MNDIMDDKKIVKCLICHNYKTTNHQSFNSHIAHAHHIKSKEYYDKYIKTDTESICKTCGKPTSFINMWKGYRDFCCNSCMSSNKEIQKRRKITSKKHYGVEFPSQSKIVKDSVAQTCLERYGVTNVYASETGKQKIKETMLERYGVENPQQSHEIRLRRSATIKKNGNRSTLELYAQKLLEDKHIKYIINYKDSIRYPWKCDLYLPDMDIFIEIHGYWAHNDHFFDANNLDDLKIVENWKNKNNDSYDTAITIWTKTDIDKRNYAINHNLNYVVSWNKEDIYNYINTL